VSALDLGSLRTQIEVNTSAIDAAVVAMGKLTAAVNSAADRIEKATSKMSGGYAKVSKAAEDSGNKQSAADTKAAAAKKANAAQLESLIPKQDKYTAALMAMFKAQRTTNDAVKVGNLSQSDANTIMARLEKTIGVTAVRNKELEAQHKKTATEAIKAAKAQETAQKQATAAAVKAANAQSAAQSKLRGNTIAAAKLFESAQLRQQKSLDSTREKVRNLTAAIQRSGTGARATKLASGAFKEYERTLSKGVLSSNALQGAQAKLESRLGTVRRRISSVNAAARKADIKAYKRRMEDLSKSVQVALGPLSGVASRITAMTALFNRNTANVAAAIGAITGFSVALFKTVKAGALFESQMLKIEGVIDATGMAAGISADEIGQMAIRVGEATLTSASAARDAAAVLLTFRGVGKETFEQVLMSAQGLSALLGGSLSDNTRRLGRLFEDPVANLNSLRRAGIQFTDAEKDKIKFLKQSGRQFELQALLLKRLEPAMKAAEAEAKGLAGQFDTLKERVAQFFEQASTGTTLVSGLSEVVAEFNAKLKVLTGDVNVTNAVGNSFTAMAELMSAALLGLVRNIDLVLAGIAGFAVGAVMKSAIGGIIAFRTSVDAAAAAASGFTAIVKRTGAAFKTLGGPIGALIAVVWALGDRFIGASDDIKTFEGELDAAKSRVDRFTGTMRELRSESKIIEETQLRKDVETFRSQVDKIKRDAIGLRDELSFSYLDPFTALTKSGEKYLSGRNSLATIFSRLVSGADTAEKALERLNSVAAADDRIIVLKNNIRDLALSLAGASGDLAAAEAALKSFSSVEIPKEFNVGDLVLSLKNLRDEAFPNIAVANQFADKLAYLKDASDRLNGSIPTSAADLAELRTKLKELVPGTVTAEEALRRLESTLKSAQAMSASEKLGAKILQLDQEADARNRGSDALAAYSAEQQIAAKVGKARNDILKETNIITKDNNDQLNNYEAALRELYKSGNKDLDEWKNAVRNWGDTFSNTIAETVIKGKSDFRSLRDSILNDLLAISIRQRIVTPILTALSIIPGSGPTEGAVGAGSYPRLPGLNVKSANGNVFNQGNVVPFANGGIVSRPTKFPMANGGTGLMGEAGTEAILPLKRLSGGNLGVQAESAPVDVRVTITNSGAQKEVRGAKVTMDPEGMIVNVILEDIRGGGPIYGALNSRGAF